MVLGEHSRVWEIHEPIQREWEANLHNFPKPFPTNHSGEPYGDYLPKYKLYIPSDTALPLLKKSILQMFMYVYMWITFCKKKKVFCSPVCIFDRNIIEKCRNITLEAINRRLGRKRWYILNEIFHGFYKMWSIQ